MTALDLSSAITAMFIIGMIWLRTRMQYVAVGNRQRGRALRLEKAGRIYFAGAVALLALGWLIAPVAGATFWPAVGANPTLARVIWFLASYYLFILVHRFLNARGIEVFGAREDDRASPPSDIR